MSVIEWGAVIAAGFGAGAVNTIVGSGSLITYPVMVLLGLLGLFLASGLQEQNAVKNVLQALVNIVAAIFFVIVGGVAWKYAAMVAIGSLIGAPVGAMVAKRIPTRGFRIGIVVFGVLMAGVMALMARS
jgi:uncharacterized membrane protein YfcA